MCCKPKMHHSSHMNQCHQVHHSCCCSSKGNRVEMLESQLSELREEAKAIEERITHMKNCG